MSVGGPAISCAFAPDRRTVDHIVLAEELGYTRAWLYDSPTLYLDAWATLAQAATRTRTIGLCSGVAVPALRHVTVTASALLTIYMAAPGRVVLGLGAGGTGMMLLRRKPSDWEFIAAYANAVRALLRGEEVEWDGAPVRLIPAWEGHPLPIDIPIVIGAEGPRGEKAARDHAQGIFSVFRMPTNDFSWSCRLLQGTVPDAGEVSTSDRAFLAAAPGAAAVYHFAYATGNFEGLDALPGGAAWRQHVDTLPVRNRFRAIWEGHLLRLSDLDRLFIPREAAAAMTCTGTAADVREHLSRSSLRGVTEIVYQPAGPDIERELRMFATAAIPVDGNPRMHVQR